MKAPNRYFGSGLLLYRFSLLASAASSSRTVDGRMPGFLCAFYALVYRLEEARLVLLHNLPQRSSLFSCSRLLSVVGSNPLFVFTMFLELGEHRARTVSILKAVLLVMMLFTVVFFLSCPFVYPREGYALWIFGMFATLFADTLGGQVTRFRIEA